MSHSTSTQSPDRRRFMRIHFDGASSVQVAGRRCPVELDDLSLKGALIHCPQTLPVLTGDPMPLAIELAGPSITLHFNATLVRIMGQQYGLRFDSIDLDTLTHLRRLMELNLGDETLLERELEHLFPDQSLS
ncbi:MAG: PilZ domain-containing protein [Marinobacterium sp.]|nr:PilZ domain-containing protein [Marinobacterium sp.]